MYHNSCGVIKNALDISKILQCIDKSLSKGEQRDGRTKKRQANQTIV